MTIKCLDDVRYLLRYTFFEKKPIALLHLLHYCNNFLGSQLLHIAIFNSFFGHYCYCYCNSSDGYCQCLGPHQDPPLYADPQLTGLFPSKKTVRFTCIARFWKCVKQAFIFHKDPFSWSMSRAGWCFTCIWCSMWASTHIR